MPRFVELQTISDFELKNLPNLKTLPVPNGMPLYAMIAGVAILFVNCLFTRVLAKTLLKKQI